MKCIVDGGGRAYQYIHTSVGVDLIIQCNGNDNDVLMMWLRSALLMMVELASTYICLESITQ